MILKTLEIIILLCLKYSIGSKNDRPVVNTTYGRILGHTLTTEKGNLYYAFQEVPFASPPIGNLRFKEPVPPENWTEVLHTTENTKICHQIDRTDTPSDVIETEDCLYLNVCTPQVPGVDSNSVVVLLPVLVWIYGGGFKNGDATFQSYGPKYYMDYDVVFVSMNYRVGPFGFLTTEDGVIPGNLGLRDQNFALQWIQSNIISFGGDPSKVTILGESSGAVSVGYHLLSKKSEGLFRAAILESGTAISSFSHQRWAKLYAFECAYALHLGFDSNSSADLLNFLQSVPAESLKNVELNVSSERENGIGSHSKTIWAPVIEDDSLDNAFITGYMHENIKNGNVVKVPIMLGFNSEEELYFINYDVSAESRRYDDNLKLLIHNKFNMSEENKTIAGAEFRKIYTPGTFEDNYGSIVKYLSDECYSTPTVRQAYLQSSYTDVYLYEFSYKGVLGATNVTVKGAEAVGHSEELHYLWDLPDNPDKSKLPASDILTRTRLLKLWTNFVKYLNPTPESDPLLQLVTWPKVSQDSIVYLNINTTLEIETDPKQYNKFVQIIEKYVSDPLPNY